MYSKKFLLTICACLLLVSCQEKPANLASPEIFDESVFTLSSHVGADSVGSPSSVNGSAGAPVGAFGSAEHIVLFPKQEIRSRDGGYYKVEIVLDVSSHPIDSCPAFNGKKHLNINVWYRKSRSSKWKHTNNLHILVDRWCSIYIHDSYAKKRDQCQNLNFCPTNPGSIISAMTTAGLAYSVRVVAVDVIREYWWVIF